MDYFLQKLAQDLGLASSPCLDLDLDNPDLLNVAFLGEITCPSSPCPLDYILRGPPASRPSDLWWSSCWTYRFAPTNQGASVLNLVITLPRKVLLKEVQILCGGGMSACPSKVIVEVSKDVWSWSDITTPAVKPLVSETRQGSSLESWVTVQFEDPKLVKKILLHIYKPEDSNYVYISQIKLLEYVGVNNATPTPIKSQICKQQTHVGQIRKQSQAQASSSSTQNQSTIQMKTRITTSTQTRVTTPMKTQVSSANQTRETQVTTSTQTPLKTHATTASQTLMKTYVTSASQTENTTPMKTKEIQESQTQITVPSPSPLIWPTQTPATIAAPSPNPFMSQNPISTPAPSLFTPPVQIPSVTPSQSPYKPPTQIPISTPTPSLFMPPLQIPSATPSQSSYGHPTKVPISTPTQSPFMIPTQTPMATPSQSSFTFPTHPPPAAPVHPITWLHQAQNMKPKPSYMPPNLIPTMPVEVYSHIPLKPKTVLKQPYLSTSSFPYVSTNYLDKIGGSLYNTWSLLDNIGGGPYDTWFSTSGSKISEISPNTIEAYHHFLKLPRYSEVLYGEIFNDRAKDFEGLASGYANKYKMPQNPVDTLPYEVLNWLLKMLPSSTEEGRNLRNSVVNEKAIDLVLEHLTVTQTQTSVSTASPSTSHFTLSGNSSKVWAKGTGFGTGYSPSSWKSMDQAIQSKQRKEEMVMSLLNLLSSFLDTPPGSNLQDVFPPGVTALLKNSCLIAVISTYLKNDSVLDISGQVPLYTVIFKLLRTIAATSQFALMLASREEDQVTIFALLIKMKDAVDTYFQILNASNSQDMDLTQLKEDIEVTASRVEEALKETLVERDPKTAEMEGDQVDHAPSLGGLSSVAPVKSLEDRYVDEMAKLQFAFLEMISEGAVFRIPYHYEGEVRQNWNQTGQRIVSRAKRLAQEAVTLKTSLPLSYGSSIFVRCDNDRLDVMKVLITGPAGTPYANGCFEFDIHFPLDYPNSPPMVNFETTEGRRIRFNPNLYADGKVCLSILNTWHGNPEEQWNPKTSSLLLVLVAIQSLIFVEEPYWNEPGHQTLGATEWKEKQSREYSAKIQYYTLQHAILNQIRRPSSSFEEVIHRHFWMKKQEILEQCKQWEENMKDMDVFTRDPFKKTVLALKNELLKMSPPVGLEDLKLDTRMIANDAVCYEHEDMDMGYDDDSNACQVQ